MTKPVVIRVFNAQGASEGAPWDEVEAAITKPSALGEVDIWLGCELAWAVLEALAKEHGLHALQYGERGSAEGGVGILSRRPIKRPLMSVGSRPTREGGGIRMRPLVTARTYGLRVTAGHAPPPRSPVARAVYFARVRAIPGLVGLDANRDVRWMRRTSVRRYRGIGVLGLLIPRRFKASVARGVKIESDHLAVDVRIEGR